MEQLIFLMYGIEIDIHEITKQVAKANVFSSAWSDMSNRAWICLNFQREALKHQIWDKVFKNEPSKICGRQPLKNLKGYGLLNGLLPYISKDKNQRLKYFEPSRINWN